MAEIGLGMKRKMNGWKPPATDLIDGFVDK
jgi:hypothetical protein